VSLGDLSTADPLEQKPPISLVPLKPSPNPPVPTGGSHPPRTQTFLIPAPPPPIRTKPIHAKMNQLGTKVPTAALNFQAVKPPTCRSHEKSPSQQKGTNFLRKTRDFLRRNAFLPEISAREHTCGGWIGEAGRNRAQHPILSKGIGGFGEARERTRWPMGRVGELCSSLPSWRMESTE
jgi:hypothetical protein